MKHMMERMVPMVKVAAVSSSEFRGGSVALPPLSTRTPTGSMDTVVMSGCKRNVWEQGNDILALQYSQCMEAILMKWIFWGFINRLLKC